MKARESNIGICVHGQHSNRRWKGNDRMLHRGDCETMSEEKRRRHWLTKCSRNKFYGVKVKYNVDVITIYETRFLINLMDR